MIFVQKQFVNFYTYLSSHRNNNCNKYDKCYYFSFLLVANFELTILVIQFIFY